MNDIELMKQLLSTVEEQTVTEANLLSPENARKIIAFKNANPGKSAEEIIKYFTDTLGVSASGVRNTVNKIFKTEKAAASNAASSGGAMVPSAGAVPKTKPEATFVGREPAPTNGTAMVPAKNNPVATIPPAGGAGGKTASKLGKTAAIGAAGIAGVSALQGDTRDGITPTGQDQSGQAGKPAATVTPKPSAPARPKLTDREEMELNALAFDLEKNIEYQPELAKILEPYYAIYGR